MMLIISRYDDGNGRDKMQQVGHIGPPGPAWPIMSGLSPSGSRPDRRSDRWIGELGDRLGV